MSAKKCKWIGGVLVLCMLFCAACDTHTTDTSQTAQPTGGEDSTSVQESAAPLPGPTQPEDIKLYPLGKNFFSFGDPSYRLVYYAWPTYVSQLAWERDSQEGLLGWAWGRLLPKDEEPQEMHIVNYLKTYNIPKEEFVEAVEEEKARLLQMGCDITSEEFELPDPDIIYTFDNDIINDYYKRGQQPADPYESVPVDTPPPVYQPGSIELGAPLDDIDDLAKPGGQSYRNSYYTLFNNLGETIMGLVSAEEWEKWENTHFGSANAYVEVNEFHLVTFIKYFNISKAAFAEAIDNLKRAEILAGRGDKMYTEDGELPNPDLLYTFDNALINAYYLRSNG